ncbi:unnamed protein product, partial [Mesorhabditis spiculigera]
MTCVGNAESSSLNFWCLIRQHEQQGVPMPKDKRVRDGVSAGRDENAEVFAKTVEISRDALVDPLLCFCQVTEREGVAVQCLYDSTPEHLGKAAMLVEKANQTITQISIRHMSIPNGQLGEGYFAKIAPELQSLEIRECPEKLTIDPKALSGLEQKILNFTVSGCRLEFIPEAVRPLENVEILDLSDNKIYNISKEDLAKKAHLRYLDLSANFINYAEEDAFAGLESLEELLLCEHNFMNETVWEEVEKLKKLKSLDLSRADGIFTVPTDHLAKLPNLETLKLSGCSIETIEAGSFNVAPKLEQLDLRVNLIENVSAFAFDGLTNLKRLSLAGNYIKTIEAVTFDGLDSLEELDLGWNELKQFPNDTFNPVAKSLVKLNLRHNRLNDVSNITGLRNLREINLSESEYLLELPEAVFRDLPSLEILDISRGNLTRLNPKAFSDGGKKLKTLKLEKSQLSTIDAGILESLPSLEFLDISGNPYRCDLELGKFVSATKDRYKNSAKMGMDFLLNEQNNTKCDRPYSLRRSLLFELEPDSFKPYGAAMDTTTGQPTTTTEMDVTEPETSSKFVLPDILVGGESNETLFKEDAPRPAYDVTKTDDVHLDTLRRKDDAEWLGITLALVGISLVTIITLIAVLIYMKKKRAARDPNSGPKKKPVDDGMVEIELNSQRGSQRRTGPRRPDARHS